MMMPTKRIFYLGILLLFIAVGALLLMYLPKSANPLSLFKTNPGTLVLKGPAEVIINEPFELEVDLDTKGYNVNAVGVKLQYDPAQLQVLQMDTRPSFCQFYPEKKFDNQLGIVSLSCGSPHPGTNGQSVLMLVQFMPKSFGDTNVSLAPGSSILVSDGKGTDILKDFSSYTVRVANNL